MIIEPEGILERINANLPKDIRIFGFRRVTNSFDAKNQCDSRSYEYILPTFAFGPMAESQKREKKSDAVKSNDVADREAHIAATTEGKEMAIGSVTKADWKLDAEALARVRKLLAVYKGTHNFHNFTSGRKPNDPSSNRHILDFTCSDPYQYDGLEYVSLFVKGQSFMLHQIRKMIGTVVWIMRYDAPDHVLTALFAAPKVNIPLVPGLGLFLKKCHYEEYARGRGKDKDPLTFEAEEHVAKEFKEKFIYKHIVSKEQAENITTSWLNSLDLHFQHTDFEKIIKEAAEAPVVSFAKRKIFGTKKAQTRDKRPKKSWEVRRNQEKKKNNNNNSNSNGDTADSNSTKQKNNDNTSKSDSAAATTTTAATKPKETSEQS